MPTLVVLRVLAATVSRASSLPALSFSGDVGLLGGKTQVHKFTIPVPPFLPFNHPIPSYINRARVVCRPEAKALFRDSGCQGRDQMRQEGFR